MSMKELHTYALHINYDVTEHDVRRHHSCTVSAQVNVEQCRSSPPCETVLHELSRT